MAAALSVQSVSGGGAVSPGDFNALLKVGAKETILNKPDKPPFALARFKSGFSRLPCVVGLRLVKGRAADLRTRSLALRYHVAGGQGVELWSETVNATELTLAECKELLLTRLLEDERKLPEEMRTAMRTMGQSAFGGKIALRLRLYDSETGKLPGKVITCPVGVAMGTKLSALIPADASRDVDVPVGLTVMNEMVSKGSEAKLGAGGHAVVVLRRWLPDRAGGFGPATEVVVEASATATAMCAAIAMTSGMVAAGGGAARSVEAGAIGLVRHWPRDAAVGSGGVIGKSWGLDAFDASLASMPQDAGGGGEDSGGQVGGGEEEEGDVLRDGDTVYWRDNSDSGAAALTAGGGEDGPPKKKRKQQSILSLFAKPKPKEQQLSLK